MDEDKTPEYKAAVDAYIPFFRRMMIEYRERIEDVMERHRPHNFEGDVPTWEEIMSYDYAEGVFHDMAFCEGIIDRIVKGRGWE